MEFAHPTSVWCNKRFTEVTLHSGVAMDGWLAVGVAWSDMVVVKKWDESCFYSETYLTEFLVNKHCGVFPPSGRTAGMCKESSLIHTTIIDTVNSETIVLQPHLLHTQPIEALMIKWSHSSTAPRGRLQIRGYFCQWHIKERGGGVCRPDEHLLLFSSPFLNLLPPLMPLTTFLLSQCKPTAPPPLACAYRESLGTTKGDSLIGKL